MINDGKKLSDGERKLLDSMLTGIDNIGCTYDEREAWSALTYPICSAIFNQELAEHPLPTDHAERIRKASGIFSAVQSQNRLKNHAHYI